MLMLFITEYAWAYPAYSVGAQAICCLITVRRPVSYTVSTRMTQTLTGLPKIPRTVLNGGDLRQTKKLS